MADIEKVLTSLECCAVGAECDHCKYAKDNKDNFEGCHQLMADALELLKEQPRWIPVKERMPDDEGLYLVSADYGNFIPWIAEMVDFRGVKGFSNSVVSPTIGAWMPLPEPWKKE